MDHRTLTNMLTLLQKLASAAYTPGQIADMLGVTPRTAYRYLATIADVGFVLQKVGDNAFTLSKTDAVYTDLSQLVHFTKEEEALVYDIMQRLSPDALIQRQLKAKMASVFNLDSVAKSVTEAGLHSSLDSLLFAVKNRCCVRLVGYHSGHSGTIQDRTVEPFEFADNFSTIWALDLADRHCKQFKLERVHSVELLRDQPWRFQQLHQSQPVDVFRSSGSTLTPICLSMDLLAKNLLSEEFPAARPFISPCGPGRWQLETQVRNLNTVGRFVLGLIDHIAIVHSPELQQDVERRINSALKG